MEPRNWPAVPGYDLLEVIGHGGFGIVFLAEEKSLLRKKRAVKVCWPSPLQSTEGVQERFRRESKTLSELSHPNIASYINSGFTGEVEPKPFVVMDYVEGVSLQKSSLDTMEQVCAVVLSLLDTLVYCHSKDVIHRDIKPSNVIVRAVDGVPVLVDFGLSINLASIGERVSKEAPGSPGYIAPELIAEPLMLDVKLDVYSMGVLIYELISRRLPDPLALRPLADFTAEADEFLDEIIRFCLAASGQRFPSVSVLRDRLASWRDLHRERVAHMSKRTARGQSLRASFLTETRRLKKDQDATARFAGEMSNLAEKQASVIFNQVLLLFREAADSLRGDLPDIEVVQGGDSHATPAAVVVGAHAKEGEILDLVVLSALDRKLSFSALRLKELRHPWTGEVLFSESGDKGPALLGMHRGGVPSPRVMQPLFAVYSQDGGESDERWLHLVVAMVFEDADFVELASLKFVAEHHPMFTKMDNLLVICSSVEAVQDEVWRVVEWFVKNRLVAG